MELYNRAGPLCLTLNVFHLNLSVVWDPDFKSEYLDLKPRSFKRKNADFLPP
jgi:hypothetical protein